MKTNLKHLKEKHIAKLTQIYDFMGSLLAGRKPDFARKQIKRHHFVEVMDINAGRPGIDLV